MNLILGIDEVGRGPWAGPLVIGACVLKPRFDEKDEPIEDEAWQEDLKDSKKLSRTRRATLAPVIREKALAYGLGWVHASELNEIGGLIEGLRLAARRAVKDLAKNFPDVEFDEIVIDGNINFLKDTEYADMVTTVIKADDRIKEVSAASIIAKVAHDEYMFELAKKYPEYSFENHVGYGTAKHRAAIAAHGITPEHRTFLKPIAAVERALGDRAEVTTEQERGAPVTTAPRDAEGQRPTGRADACRRSATTTAIGRRAELIVARELTRRGHKILARNYKTKTYEIDIVSATKDHIYFTEVKYRKTKTYGSPLEFITAKKREQMTYAAEKFMQKLKKELPEKQLPSPALAAASVSGKDFEFETWLEIF